MGGFIIRDVYEDKSTPEKFEAQLDKAFRGKENIILIEPVKLGGEIKQFIVLGNRFHKSAVLCGLGSLVAMASLPSEKSHLVSLPLAVTGWFCTAVYDLTWQFDPCSKYQLLRDKSKLNLNVIGKLNSTSALVIERKDDRVRKILHNALSIATLMYFSWKYYSLNFR